MPQVSRTERIILNGYDLSCYLNQIGEDVERDLKSADVFCSDGAKTNEKGLHGVEFTAEGFNEFDPTVATIIDTLFQNAIVEDGENLILHSMGDGFAVGDVAVMLNLNTVKYSISEIEAGELIMASLTGNSTQASGTSGLAHGVWLMSEVVTGVVDGAAYDSTAHAAGWVAHVHNTDADGTATVKIQHSSNGTVWVDLIDFGAVAANGAEQSVDTTTAVSRFQRAIVTAIGGTTAKVSVAFK